MKALIVYGSGREQAARIARYIAQSLRNHGHDVDLIDGRALPIQIDPAGLDVVVIGASVNSGRFQRYIVDFVKEHQAALRRVPSAFFSVSLREAEPEPAHRAQAMNPIQRLFKDTDWNPDVVASFAGSIEYLRYRWLMRIIWSRLPLPGDDQARAGSHRLPDGYEYTDWAAVSAFVQHAEAIAKAGRPVPSQR